MEQENVELQGFSGILAHYNGQKGKIDGRKGMVHDTLRVEIEGGNKIVFATEAQIKRGE